VDLGKAAAAWGIVLGLAAYLVVVDLVCSAAHYLDGDKAEVYVEPVLVWPHSADLAAFCRLAVLQMHLVDWMEVLSISSDSQIAAHPTSIDLVDVHVDVDSDCSCCCHCFYCSNPSGLHQLMQTVDGEDCRRCWHSRDSDRC